MTTLFLIRGVPGAGKSTLAEFLNVDFKIAADDFHTDENGNYNWKAENSKAGHSWCKEQTELAMSQGKSVAVHNTFTEVWEMQPYFDLARQYGYKVSTIIVENRHNSTSIHNVPDETIRKMEKRFDVVLAPKVKYEDYVKVKQSGDLFIHKYKKKVFYDNLWDQHKSIVEARGLILDSYGTIVQYPFTKIFNRNENGVDIPVDHKVLAIDKINGFMAAVTYYDGELLVSTTGSMDSDFVNMAKEILPLNDMREILEIYQDYTFCFEIVHPNDPHIIVEEIGAYLIGGREKVYGSQQLAQTTLDRIAAKIGVKRPSYKWDSFGNILSELKYYTREGFVVYDTESETVLKLKSPYYLSAKFIARTKNMDKIFDKQYKQKFDEEFYGLCEHLQKTYSKDEFLAIPEQEKLEIVRKWAETDYV